MSAVVYDRYGPPDVLRLEEVERPVPKQDEVLVRIHATTVNRFDVHTREANVKSGLAVSFLSRLVSGLRGPRQRILGSEFAGEVVAVGAAVTGFAVGDHIFGAQLDLDSGHTPNSSACGRAPGSRPCQPA